MSTVYPENTSIPGLVPLTAACGTYTRDGHTEDLGLYPGGINVLPEDHPYLLALIAAGAVIAQAEDVHVVFAGMSNAEITANAFLELVAAETQMNPAMHFANLADGGCSLGKSSNPAAPWWTTTVPAREAEYGVDPAKVRILIFLEPSGSILQDNSNPDGIPLGFPGYALWVAEKTKATIELAKARYPALDFVAVTAATYGGFGGIYPVDPAPLTYGTNPIPVSKRPPPFGDYEEAFGLREVIRQRIDGEWTGPVVDWLCYPWSNGILPAPVMPWDKLVAMTTAFGQLRASDGIHPDGPDDPNLAEAVATRLIQALYVRPGIRLVANG